MQRPLISATATARAISGLAHNKWPAAFCSPAPEPTAWRRRVGTVRPAVEDSGYCGVIATRRNLSMVGKGAQLGEFFCHEHLQRLVTWIAEPPIRGQAQDRDSGLRGEDGNRVGDASRA